MESTIRWHERSKAKDAQYFTPPSVAEAICQTVEGLIDKEDVVIDPTAGSGRLLMPFKKKGYPVFASKTLNFSAQLRM